MFNRVLLCYDGSQAGRSALRRGAELAILLRAQVHVLSIIPSHVAQAPVLAAASGHSCVVDDVGGYRRLLDGSLEWLRARGVQAEGSLATGNIIEQIVSHAKRLAVDLVVLGHYPQPSGGFWWSGPQRTPLAERLGCCVFVAVGEPTELQAGVEAQSAGAARSSG